MAYGDALTKAFSTQGYLAEGDGWQGSLDTRDDTNSQPDIGAEHLAAAIVAKIGGKVLHLGVSTTASASSSSASTGTPDATTVKTWPAKWCQAQPGMTRDQLRSLMGPPTSAFGPNTTTPQMSWDAYEYQFNAFFDVNDKVRQLDINDIQLTQAEKAALTCTTTRSAQ